MDKDSVVLIESESRGRDSPTRAGVEWSSAKSAPQWVTLVVCCVAQFMVVLDISIVNVALPQMKSGLHLSASGQQWVVNAYTLTFAGLLLLGGRAADMFGSRRILLLGVGSFTGFSVLGGLAQNGAWLIIARALQGASGAALVPATLSLLITSYTDPAARRRALGAWSTIAASGAAVGVLVGGVLTELFNWRWVLFVNAPLGAVALLGAAITLGRTVPHDAGRRLDVAGALTVTAGLSTVVFGIVATKTHPWASAWTLFVLAIGVALLGAFALIELRVAKQPLIPVGIFRHRALTAANGVSFAIGGAFFSLFFFLSLYLQQINHYSPLVTGLAFLPIGLSVLTAAVLAPRLIVLIGLRRQLLLSLIIAASGMLWLMRLTPHVSYWPAVLLPELLAGTGLGLSFLPMTIGATAGIAPQYAGLASGLVNTTRQIGGAVSLAAASAAAAAVHARTATRDAVAAAFTTGYDRAFAISAGVLAAGAVVAILLPKERRG